MYEHRDLDSAKDLSKDLEKQKAAKKARHLKRLKKKLKRSILNLVSRKCLIDSHKKAKLDDALVEFIVMENLSLEKVDKSCLRRLLFIAQE